MRTVLVSGAGSGIGRETIIALDQLKFDYRFVLSGRNLENLKDTRRLLRDPEKSAILCADLRRAKDTCGAFKRLKEQLQGLTAVIANAGIALNNCGIDQNWNDILETNLTATYRFILEALPFLQSSSQEYRHIVIISSALARVGAPGLAAYCATKAGLLGLMRSLAVELAPQKILVNAVCPSWVDTPMAERAAQALAIRARTSETMARRQLVQRSLLPKFTKPSEVGRLVAFLVSDGQNSMTGQTIDINNGDIMA